MESHDHTRKDKQQAGGAGCCCGTEAAATKPDASRGSVPDKPEAGGKPVESGTVQQKPKAGGCCGSC